MAVIRPRSVAGEDRPGVGAFDKVTRRTLHGADHPRGALSHGSWDRARSVRWRGDYAMPMPPVTP